MSGCQTCWPRCSLRKKTPHKVCPGTAEGSAKAWPQGVLRRMNRSLSQQAKANAQGTADFTADEFEAMHDYCLTYRALVRGGGTPTAEQDSTFRAFSTACYRAGVAYGN